MKSTCSGIGSGPIPIRRCAAAAPTALFIKSGFETGDDRDGGAINTSFRRDRYHTPEDEADQGFDWRAGVSHAQVNFLTGYYVAMQDEPPAWNPEDFFGGLFDGR